MWLVPVDWFEIMQLREHGDFAADLQDTRANLALGERITKRFKALGLCRPYTLRHCYARRCQDNLIPVQIAVRLMGHSVKIHTQTYHRWVKESDDDRLLEKLLT